MNINKAGIFYSAPAKRFSVKTMRCSAIFGKCSAVLQFHKIQNVQLKTAKITAVRAQITDFCALSEPISARGNRLEWGGKNSVVFGMRGALTLSFPRVINVKFLLQPHQKYKSHSMKNLAFHSLLRWKMIILPILTTSPYIALSSFGECYFLMLGVKGLSSKWRFSFVLSEDSSIPPISRRIAESHRCHKNAIVPLPSATF